MHKLTADIKNLSKPGKFFGSKGEQVTILFDYGNQVIVENGKGERYSVLKEQINPIN